jgi:hypothetical protein
MPAVITAYALLVWFAVGFMLALGWTLGTWCMSKILSALP